MTEISIAQSLKDRESLEKIYRISTKLNSTLRLDKILEPLSKSLLELTEFDICNIFLPDTENRDYLVNVYASDKDQYFAKERVLLKETNHLKEVFIKKKYQFYCGTDRNMVKPKLHDYLNKYNITCSVHIPIMIPHGEKDSKSEVRGCIILDKKEGSCDTYSKKLDKNIMILINQVAIAIDNSLLYQMLENQRDRWYAIFEDTTDSIIIVDDKLKINKANSAFKEMVDLEAKEVIGTSIRELFEYEEEYTLISKDIMSGLGNEKIETGKREVFLKIKKDIFPASLKISFIKSTKDYPRAILSFEDISKEKELEQNKDDFISIVSHELRSPITIIRGYLSLLEKKEMGSLNEKQERFLTKTIQSTDKMASLLEGILEANRMSLGKVKLKLSPINLTNVFKNVLLDLKTPLKERNIKVTMKETRIPKVYADEVRLYQIVHNIMDNARKYSDKNGNISINFQAKGNKVLFTVEDHGVGMSALERKKIFKRFTRAENALSNEAGGFGLGLYIVKSLIISHKGRIWFESEKGKGTKVNVLLNIAE